MYAHPSVMGQLRYRVGAHRTPPCPHPAQQESCFILVEGLRRELQPFDHRQVGEQLVGQFLHRHPVANRQCGRLDQFARFRGHCLHADQSSAAFFNHQFDEAARVELASARGTLSTLACDYQF